jgi:pyruvate/2-oxoglutarate dehydrogenase complex dihydrolipoamide acyltransferase (E2) component
MTKQIKAEGIRKIIAERMSDSWHTSPRVVYTLSVDMSNALSLIEQINQDNQDPAFKVTMNHLLMKLCADAMKEYEYVNSSFENDTITIHDQINIGLAVAIENGLIVPNVKDIGNKDLRTIAKDTNDAVDRTRKNRITMDDITGGTFTITNLGMLGIESFSPIINQPEVAILGVNKITPTPVVVDGEIAIRPMMNLNFVADHRVIDGAYAAKFISSVKGMLEDVSAEDNRTIRAV